VTGAIVTVRTVFATGGAVGRRRNDGHGEVPFTTKVSTIPTLNVEALRDSISLLHMRTARTKYDDTAVRMPLTGRP
jgi:hypothetical protein